MKLFFLLLLLLPSFAFGIEKADFVLIKKSESMLYLIKNEKVIGKYSVAFGGNPKGHKKQEGDERTPEGEYVLDYKQEDSDSYKSIHISYPDKQDKKRAEEAGVDPGGFIMIHGQNNGFGWLSWLTQRFNWTEGCIAVSNGDMDEIWKAVDPGTPIEIKP
ncbi:MAG: murein L,D-transpeptidase family protein [Desulfobacterales bacterium]